MFQHSIIRRTTPTRTHQLSLLGVQALPVIWRLEMIFPFQGTWFRTVQDVTPNSSETQQIPGSRWKSCHLTSPCKRNHKDLPNIWWWPPKFIISTQCQWVGMTWHDLAFMEKEKQSCDSTVQCKATSLLKVWCQQIYVRWRVRGCSTFSKSHGDSKRPWGAWGPRKIELGQTMVQAAAMGPDWYSYRR